MSATKSAGDVLVGVRRRYDPIESFNRREGRKLFAILSGVAGVGGLAIDDVVAGFSSSPSHATFILAATAIATPVVVGLQSAISARLRFKREFDPAVRSYGLPSPTPSEPQKMSDEDLIRAEFQAWGKSNMQAEGLMHCSGR